MVACSLAPGKSFKPLAKPLEHGELTLAADGERLQELKASRQDWPIKLRIWRGVTN